MLRRVNPTPRLDATQQPARADELNTLGPGRLDTLLGELLVNPIQHNRNRLGNDDQPRAALGVSNQLHRFSDSPVGRSRCQIGGRGQAERSPLEGERSGPGFGNADDPQGATAPALEAGARMNFWDIILSIFWFMLLFAWIWLLISIFADIFRDHELSGWGKALWGLFIIVIPWLGALVYLIARGRSMNERALAQAQRQDHAFRHYVQDAAGNQPSAADEIAKLATLRDQGAISEQEFAHAKAKLLGTPSNGAPVPPNQSAAVR